MLSALGHLRIYEGSEYCARKCVFPSHIVITQPCVTAIVLEIDMVNILIARSRRRKLKAMFGILLDGTFKIANRNKHRKKIMEEDCLLVAMDAKCSYVLDYLFYQSESGGVARQSHRFWIEDKMKLIRFNRKQNKID
eukprot:Nk52_evm50s217 gene=Nk52_evmTU50s217